MIFRFFWSTVSKPLDENAPLLLIGQASRPLNVWSRMPAVYSYGPQLRAALFAKAENSLQNDFLLSSKATALLLLRKSNSTKFMLLSLRTLFAITTTSKRQRICIIC